MTEEYGPLWQAIEAQDTGNNSDPFLVEPDMTKTQAAEIIANDVVVWAREHGIHPSKDLVEGRISEWSGITGAGTLKGRAAQLANWRTTLRIALDGFFL